MLEVLEGLEGLEVLEVLEVLEGRAMRRLVDPSTARLHDGGRVS